MNQFSRAVFRIARFIAGSERAEWIDAMTAEAATLEGDCASWAMGCLWASIKDRSARDWWFPLAVTLVPICVVLWKMKIFFWTASLLAQNSISDWAAVTCWILSPFPIAFAFALWRQGVLAYVAVAICFTIVEALPLAFLWMAVGSPIALFGPNVNWYKADPGIRIGVVEGIALDLLVWLAAVWLGSRIGRRRTTIG